MWITSHKYKYVTSYTHTLTSLYLNKYVEYTNSNNSLLPEITKFQANAPKTIVRRITQIILLFLSIPFEPIWCFPFFHNIPCCVVAVIEHIRQRCVNVVLLHFLQFLFSRLDLFTIFVVVGWCFVYQCLASIIKFLYKIDDWEINPFYCFCSFVVHFLVSKSSPLRYRNFLSKIPLPIFLCII